MDLTHLPGKMVFFFFCHFAIKTKCFFIYSLSTDRASKQRSVVERVSEVRSGEQEHEEERANDKMGERMARLPYTLILHNFLPSCTVTGDGDADADADGKGRCWI